MTRLYSPLLLAFVGILAAIGLLESPNAKLWAVCLLMLPVIVWLLGGKIAYPVLAWVVGVNWLQVAAVPLGADLSGLSLIHI